MELRAERKPSEGPGQSTFPPLKKKRYSDRIADVIQERIFKEHLEAGTSLPSEHDLSKEFQVSRSVVREALRILEISGLVKIKKGPLGGIFVSNSYHAPFRKSLKNMVASGTVTVDQLFEVRLLIEPHIARQAARHATSSDIKKLEQLLQDSAAHLDDPVYLKKNNLNFHLLLARACGNPVMSILMESVFELLIESSLDFLDLSLERRFFEVHRKTFQLIKKKKPEESAKAMRKDILDVKKRLKGFKKKNLDD